MTLRRCAECSKWKPLGAFYRVHKRERRRQRLCKTCDNRRRSRASVVVMKRRDFLRDPYLAMRKARTSGPVHIVDERSNLRAVLSIPRGRR